MVNINLSKEQEDYLLVLFELQESYGISKLTEISRILNFSTGAVNDELNRLERMGLIKKIPYRGIMFTDTGLETAWNVVRKHRIAEAFLYYVLNVPWEKCHVLSSDIEHAIDGPLEKYIMRKLKNLKTCPHGNPITLNFTKDDIKLIDAEINGYYKVSRITFEEQHFLEKFKSLGILPQERIKLIEKNSEGGVVQTKKGKFILDANDLNVIRVEK